MKKSLLDKEWFNITEYCNAAIDEAYDYCIEEFKKACEMAGIAWQDEWEDILHG